MILYVSIRTDSLLWDSMNALEWGFRVLLWKYSSTKFCRSQALPQAMILDTSVACVSHMQIPLHVFALSLFNWMFMLSAYSIGRSCSLSM